MKHLLDIKYFLTEALTPYYKKVYNKVSKDRSPEVIARLNHLLDNKERVYIPYNPNTISETQLKVKDYLEDQGYNILDYRGNSAVQIENSKRTIRISKLLAKDPALLKEFTLDDTRANTKSGSEFSIVLTSNYEDVAGMSFQRCWGSCMNLKGGENRHYVQFDVMEGTILAYLIKNEDTNIDNPLGRITIKPYSHRNNEKEIEIVYIPDQQVYGNVPDLKTFFDVVNGYLKEKQIIKTSGFYNKYSTLYSDSGSPQVVMVKKDGTFCYDCEFDDDGYDYNGYNEDGYNKEGYDKYGVHISEGYPYQEYITKKQYLFLKKGSISYEIWRGNHSALSLPGVEISKDNYKEDGHIFSITKDGKIDVEGSFHINDDILEFPVVFNKVTGNFKCHYNTLTTLVGSPIEVGGDYKVTYTEITSTKGISKRVWGNVDLSRNEKLSLIDEFPEIGNELIVGDIDLSRCNLTSLGSKLPENVRVFKCQYNKLKTLEGSPKTTYHFNCSNNILTNLIGGPVFVQEDYDCSYNKLTSLEGAPKEVYNFDCSDNKLKSFKGIEDMVVIEDLNCSYNFFESLDFLPKKLGKETQKEYTSFWVHDNTPPLQKEDVEKVLVADKIVV